MRRFGEKQSESIRFGFIFARNSPNQSGLDPFSRKTVQINQVWIHFREKQSKSVRFGSVFAKNSPFQTSLGSFWRKTVRISQVWVHFGEKQSKSVRFGSVLAKNSPNLSRNDSFSRKTIVISRVLVLTFLFTSSDMTIWTIGRAINNESRIHIPLSLQQSSIILNLLSDNFRPTGLCPFEFVDSQLWFAVVVCIVGMKN